MIQPGENLLLDGGSAAGALPHKLRSFEKLSVTTPGTNSLHDLAESESIEVDCMASASLPPRVFVWPCAEATLERTSLDRSSWCRRGPG